MAAASSNIHSPRSSGDPAAALNSPKSRRPRGVSSPWKQIVRGGESESVVSSAAAGAAAAVAPSSPSSSSGAVLEQIANSSSDWPPSKSAEVATADSAAPDDYTTEAQPESSDNGSGSSNEAKKPAWNVPSNGVSDVSPIMGAVAWPALSESTRTSPKSSSSDSLKALSDGSLSPSQGTGITSSSLHKQVAANNANPNSTPNHTTTTRQRSMKRPGGNSSGGVSANGGFPHPPPPAPQVSVVELPPSSSGKPVTTVGESSTRDHSHKETGQKGGFGSQTHGSNDHHQQRNSFRRGNGGSHPRGDGSYHHSYGGRRDQDRGNQDWNPHRSFGSRDGHMQPQRVVPRGFIRPPPHTTTPFIPPPAVPVRPFGNPMVYPGPEVAPPVIYVQGPPPESLRGVPLVAPIPPHTMFFPVPDPQLHTKIVNQIDYYFSNENLIKDTFLRQNMDDQGWVPIKLIAGFKKVMLLTDNIQLILDAVRTSSVVEIQGDKVRRRNDWMKWIMPRAPFSSVSSPQSLGRPSRDMLAAHLQIVTLDDKQGHAEMFFSRSSSGEFSSQSQEVGGEGTSQVTVQAGFERSAFA